jgi:hypothetical protein
MRYKKGFLKKEVEIHIKNEFFFNSARTLNIHEFL